MQYAGIYFDTIQKLLAKTWDSQKEAMQKAVDVMTACVERGGLIHVFGCGHTQILVEEVWFRAGQPSFISPIFDQGLWPHNAPHKGSALEKLEGYGRVIFENHDAKPGEVIIVLSNSGRNAVPIEVALEAKKRGLTVVGITSMDYSTRVKSRHSSGKKLYEIADIVIDNGGPEGDAIVEIPGLKQKAGPCTTITNAAILDAMLVQVVANLVARKGSAPVFVSANLDLPADANEGYIAPYLSRIHHYKG
ncbi:MAG: SIS domain-containing protein [Firmicutes bacterium]|nr:SIS domain-containing protein [Candidatus Fermentithermobacillaceae bacterium]